MSSYSFLAGCYDRLTYDVDYAAWADYIEKHFAQFPLTGKTVLDLACGTGSLTRELALRGYEMIGVDQSPEMLAEAADKNRGISPIEPIFLCQSMEKLDLYGTIDACVCCLDSVNYVTRPAALRRTFRRAYRALAPGGLFLFDVKTPAALEGADGQTYLDEDEDLFCVWRGDYSHKRRVCGYGLDLFVRERDGSWSRAGEYHEEYAYTPEELDSFLREAGFQTIQVYGDKTMRPPREEAQRIFFAAGKEL